MMMRTGWGCVQRGSRVREGDAGREREDFVSFHALNPPLFPCLLFASASLPPIVSSQAALDVSIISRSLAAWLPGARQTREHTHPLGAGNRNPRPRLALHSSCSLRYQSIVWQVCPSAPDS